MKKKANTYAILENHGNLYCVSSSSGKVYLVDMTFPANPSCNCEGARWHPGACSHIKHVQGVINGSLDTGLPVCSEEQVETDLIPF